MILNDLVSKLETMFLVVIIKNLFPFLYRSFLTKENFNAYIDSDV